MSISKLLFGEIALKKKLVTKEQVDECLEIQKKLKEMGITRTLGAVMHDKKFLSMVEIKEILREMTGTKDWNAIEGYEILGKLGKGGMGAVYKARHQKLNKIVALKVLPPELAADQEYLNRFLREARAAAKLNHVNIVQALDVGESYGYHYFVMEYAEGRTVKDIIEAQDKIDEATALDIVEQIASALAHASKNDLVHRDIKPSNIIVNSEGVAKLLDLGLAKSISEDQTITQTGVIMGTPFYLSPEQARSEDLDARSDIYSLGVTLFHMLTGQVPFSGNSAATILYKHIFQDPPKPRSVNPKVSPQVSSLVTRMMAKSREDRPPTPDALIEEIRAVRENAGLAHALGPGARSPAQAPASAGAGALVNTLASSGPTTDVATMNEPALDLAISGPQSPASPDSKTEVISREGRRRGRRVAAEEDAVAARARRATRIRLLVAAGACTCLVVVIALVARSVWPAPPPQPDVVTDLSFDILGDQAPSQRVREGLARIDALRVEGKLREAVDMLSDLSAGGTNGAKLEVPDEIALDRARTALVNAIAQKARELIKAHEGALAGGESENSETLVVSIKGLELPAILRLVEADRKRLEGEGAARADPYPGK